jgi:hypothetical protein
MKEHEIKVAEFEKKIASMRNLSRRLELYKEYRNFMVNIDEDKAFEVSIRAIELCKKIGNLYDEHVFKIHVGFYLLNRNKADETIKLNIEAKDYFLSIGDKEAYVKTLVEISYVFAQLDLINQAIFLWKDILINFAENDTKLKYLILNNLIHASLSIYQKYDNAEQILLEIFNYYEANKLEKDRQYCNSLGNYSVLLLHKKEYRKAIRYLEESIDLAQKNQFKEVLFSAYSYMGDSFKGLNDEVNMLTYYIKASKVFDYENVMMINLYSELYQYYKSKDNLKLALKYFEILHRLEMQKKEQQFDINNVLEKIGFDMREKGQDLKLKEYSKKHLFDFNRQLFLENIKGNLIKINIDSVVYVQSVNKIIKIHFADKTTYSFKLSLKEFADKIQESFGKEHLLFSTNQRCEMVNLFWVSKYEKLQKKIFLNVLGEEFEFEVTRSQTHLLKDFFENK